MNAFFGGFLFGAGVMSALAAFSGAALLIFIHIKRVYF